MKYQCNFIAWNNSCNHKTFTIRKARQILDSSLGLNFSFAFLNIFHIFFLQFFEYIFFLTTADLAILILLSKTMWSSYRPAGRIWPATVFSVALGSIQEKSSNLIFVEKRVRSHLDKVHFHDLEQYPFCVSFRFIHLFCDQIRTVLP